jgi:hypothetical protein
LFLGSNDFAFRIPSEIGRLTRLQDGVDFSQNQLIGSVPSEIGALTSLRQLRLNGNFFAGQLPPEISALGQLRVLRIDENDLTGAVPDELCAVFDFTEPAVYADCTEISCPCCSHCCIDGQDCVCVVDNDPIRCGGS